MAEIFVDSNAADDTGAGTQADPIKTLAEFRLRANEGDTGRLIRGGVWNGEQLLFDLVAPTMESERVTVKPYGNGAHPIIAPGADATVTITAVSAYEADEAGKTTITASGGGFTGSLNKTLHFVGDDAAGKITTVVSDTQVRVDGDFSTAAASQTGKVYSLLCCDYDNQNYITVQGIRFKDGIGIDMGNGGRTELDGCYFDSLYNAEGYIIDVSTISTTTYLTSNTIHHIPKCAGAIGGALTRNALIQGNVIFDVDGPGMRFPLSTSLRIDSNNIGAARKGAIGGNTLHVAIDLSPATSPTVRYNTIWDYDRGIMFLNGVALTTTDPLVYGNIGYVTSGFAGTTMPMVYVDASVAGATFTGFDFYDNTVGDLGGVQDAVVILTHASATVDDIAGYDNIFFTDRLTPGAGFSIGTDATNVTIDNNRYNNYTMYTTGGNDANSVSIDPVFIDYVGQNAGAFDFRLANTSPCIGTGTADLSSRVTMPDTYYDAYGTLREKDGGDIGAATAASSGSYFARIYDDAYELTRAHVRTYDDAHKVRASVERRHDDATLYGSPYNPPYSTSPLGTGFLDIAGGQRIEIQPSPDFDFGTGDFTIDFWMRPDFAYLCHPFNWYYGPDDYATFYALEANGNDVRMRFVVRVGGVDIIDVDTGPQHLVAADGNWRHVAIEREGRFIRLYLGGILFATTVTAITEDVDLSLHTLQIGQAYLPGEYEFGRYDGGIDEFRVHGEATYGGATFTPKTAPYVRTITRRHDSMFNIKIPVARYSDSAFGLNQRTMVRRYDDAHTLFMPVERRADDSHRIYASFSRQHDDSFGLALRSIARRMDDAWQVTQLYERRFDDAFTGHSVFVDRVSDDAFIVNIGVDRRHDDAVSNRTAIARSHADAYRISDGVDQYELLYQMGEEPDIEAQPVATSATLPMNAPAITGAGLHFFLLRRRNEFGLISENVEHFVIELDSAGNELNQRPSAPLGLRVEIVDMTAQTVRVMASHIYGRDEQQADTWVIYHSDEVVGPTIASSRELPQTPWPEGPYNPTTVEETMIKDDGVAKLNKVITVDDIANFNIGVRVKRSSDGRLCEEVLRHHGKTGLQYAGQKELVPEEVI